MGKRNEEYLLLTRAIKSEHPFWGYRRVWAYLKYRQGYEVNKKRIYGLMKENDLLVKKQNRNKAKRASNRPKPRAEYPNQYWGIVMTKIKINSWGWLYLTIVLDWFTKEIVGYSLGMQSKTDDWLSALNMGINERFPKGIKDSMQYQLYLVSDNGCQPTSQTFMKACGTMGIKQIFTTWSNPKGNSDTERVLRTLKEDLIWPNDWDNPFVFQRALVQWIDDYNNDFPHQSLHYMTPQEYFTNHQTKGSLGF